MEILNFPVLYKRNKSDIGVRAILYRGTLVNVNRIQFIYRDLQQIHFDERAEGVFCPIAYAHIVRMRKTYPQIELRTSN